MNNTSMTYLAVIAILLSSAQCAVQAAPSTDDAIDSLRRLDADYAAHGGDERLEAWRNGLDEYGKEHLRTLDFAFLKARFHYYGERNACAAVNALKPYMHYTASRSEIPYFIWKMCGELARFADDSAKYGVALEPLVNELKSADGKMLPTLRSYWASFIPDDFKAAEMSDIAKCKGGCTHEEGLKAWREFLDVMEKAEIARRIREEKIADAKRLKASGVKTVPLPAAAKKPAAKTSGVGVGVEIVPDGE